MKRYFIILATIACCGIGANATDPPRTATKPGDPCITQDTYKQGTMKEVTVTQGQSRSSGTSVSGNAGVNAGGISVGGSATTQSGSGTNSSISYQDVRCVENGNNNVAPMSSSQNSLNSKKD